ncbi:MAG: site-2 protease family protein [Nocardioidaceae bacterium]
MTTLLYLLGVFVFVLALVVSVALHEMGHMIPAKRFGARVSQFFVGFGTTVWSRQKGETEYGVKALPLGGYVKIVGMLPPDPKGDPAVLRQSSTGFFSQLISDARTAEAEHVRPEDADRLFYKLTWWKKVIVMAAGPSVNILIAFLLFWGIFATVGNARDEHATLKVDDVSPCIVPAAETGRACTANDPATPAYQAGIRAGDVIDSFNGTTVHSWEQLSVLIRANGDDKAVIGYTRDGVEKTVETSTVVTPRPKSTTDDSLVKVGFLGVQPVTEIPTGGPIYTLRQMGEMTKNTAEAFLQMPVKVWGVAKAIVGVEPRDPESPVSIVGGGRLAGEVVSEHDTTIQDKIVFLVVLVAGFNFFVGMFNFIPLLPLDGGHIAGALYEGLRRGIARLFGRPDPGFVDIAKLMPIAYVGAGALMLMGVVLIVADLVVPLHVTG